MFQLNKLPIINRLAKKFNHIESNFIDMDMKLCYVSNQVVDNRLRYKKLNNMKVVVVFICHRPAVWGALNSVYESFFQDDRFKTIVVTVPNKKQIVGLGLNHEEYQSEGAELYWKDYNPVSGYNYDTGEWLDLRYLEPDYVFYQQPYNQAKPMLYQSSVVSKYAKICYVHYGANVLDEGVLIECTPENFMKNVSFMFTQDIYDDAACHKRMEELSNPFTKMFLTGYPKYDGRERLRDRESNSWNFSNRENKFRIIWTPRWTTNEGTCNFFDYKDKLLGYCDKHLNIDFLFRPHPQAFQEWNATGELKAKDAEAYKAGYDRRENTKIDYNNDYLEIFYSSDCLITDVSSVIADYFLTAKPIIYCHKRNCFSEFTKKISEGFYWVKSWEELELTLDMLRNGEDPLYEKRQELIRSCYYFTENTAGENIKKIIEYDAFK